MNSLDPLIRIVGLLGLGGLTLAVLVGIAFQFFKWFGAKWIDDRFQRSLADYQHRQTMEVERFRDDAARLLDRAVKFHSMEFEVLPEAWAKLSQAYGSAIDVAVKIQHYADITWLSDEDAEAIIATRDWSETDRRSVMDSTRQDRQKKFVETEDWYRVSKAFRDHADFQNYIISKTVFIEPGIYDQMMKVSQLIVRALNEMRMAQRDPESRREVGFQSREVLLEDGESEVAKVRESVSKRLWVDLAK